jgi:hypothetical protein
MSYTTLVFEPKILNPTNPENVLWKAQISAPPNYKSIMITLMEDLIALSNRRTLLQWINILKENNYNYEINFDHEACKEYIIADSPLVSYSLQLFACNLSEGQNKVEISSEYILPILFILDLQKNKSYNPVLVNKKIENALDLISVSSSDPTNLVMINNLKILERLILVCIDYEVDVKCTIEVRA